MDRGLVLRRLDATSAGDREDLQAVLSAAPEYSHLVTGQPPSVNAADEMFAARPATRCSDDKHVFGVYRGGQPMGCVDMIRGYPEAGIAWIGLLLFAKSCQNRSFGPVALAALIDVATGWHCDRLRLAVIETNRRALVFWQREGFVAIGRKTVDGFAAPAIVMERCLPGR